MSRLLFSLWLILGPISLGYAARRLGWLAESHARQIIRWTILCFAPVTSTLSFWVLPIHQVAYLTLPVVGAGVTLACLWPAWLAGRWLRMSREQLGSFLLCAMFSNLGYIGSVVCFLFLGEAAYSLSLLYLLSFSPCLYTVGFSIGRRCGTVGREPGRRGGGFDEYQRYPLMGMALGFILNLLGVARPAWCGQLNTVLIPWSTAFYLVAVGVTLRLRRVPANWRPALVMSGIKFLYSPLVGLALGWLAGYGRLLGGLPLAVVWVVASTPVAISALIWSPLFGLDQDLANSLWLVTTAVFLAWLPVVVWGLHVVK